MGRVLKMTKKQLLKKINQILRHYDKIEKNWQNSGGQMLLAIQRDKNDEILRMLEYYKNQ
jgi:hypothetical protein